MAGYFNKCLQMKQRQIRYSEYGYAMGKIFYFTGVCSDLFKKGFPHPGAMQVFFSG